MTTFTAEDALCELALYQGNLVRAVIEDNHDLVTLLMQHGAHPHRYTSSRRTIGVTAWGVACSKDLTNMISLLLQFGANVDADIPRKHMGHETALMLCARRNLVDTAEILTRYNADVDKVVSGTTALITAVKAGSHEMVTFLLSKGAQVYIEDSNAQSALWHAFKNKDTSVIIQLFKENALGRQDRHDINQTALHLAIYMKDLNLIKELLNENCPVDIQDEAGRTPLMFAAFKGDIDLVKFFLDQGADIHKKSYIGDQALDYALQGVFKRRSETDDWDDLKELIVTLSDRGASIPEDNMLESEGMWIVYQAMIYKKEQLIQQNALLVEENKSIRENIGHWCACAEEAPKRMRLE